MKSQGQSLSDQKRYKLEAPLTKKVKEWLDGQRDISYYKASDGCTKGVSDIIACVGGIFVAIELKKDTGISSAQQRLYISNVERANGIAGVAYTLGEVKELVERARRWASTIKKE